MRAAVGHTRPIFTHLLVRVQFVWSDFLKLRYQLFIEIRLLSIK